MEPQRARGPKEVTAFTCLIFLVELVGNLQQNFLKILKERKKERMLLNVFPFGQTPTCLSVFSYLLMLYNRSL